MWSKTEEKVEEETKSFACLSPWVNHRNCWQLERSQREQKPSIPSAFLASYPPTSLLWKVLTNLTETWKVNPSMLARLDRKLEPTLNLFSKSGKKVTVHDHLFRVQIVMNNNWNDTHSTEENKNLTSNWTKTLLVHKSPKATEALCGHPNFLF